MLARSGPLALLFAASLSVSARAQTALAADSGRLDAPTLEQWSQFGRSVAVDGGRAVVGSPYRSGGGSVHAFDRSGTRWVVGQQLAATGASAAAQFGWAVALSNEVLVVGAPRQDTQSGMAAGRATVFVRDAMGGAWVERQHLYDPSGLAQDLFGHGVAVDDDQILIAAPGEAQSSLGSVVVFDRDRSGTPADPLDDQWVYRQDLTPVPQQSGSRFAEALSFSGDRLAVGAYVDDNPIGSDGSVYVFQRTAGTWQQSQRLAPTSLTGSYWYGISVALEGHRLAVGAHHVNGGLTTSGKVVVYETTGGLFAETAVLSDPGPGAASGFGSRVELDPERLFAASPWDSGAGSQHGLVRLFVPEVSGWQLRQTLYSNAARDNQKFGSVLDSDGASILVGVPEFDVGASLRQSGGVYSYDLGQGGHFIRFGFGDGSGTACPCGNDSHPLFGGGCDNSSARGGRLVAAGSALAAADALHFTATNLIPGELSILFSGADNLSPGLAFGDGLRLVGGAAVRHRLEVPDANGEAFFGPGLAPPTGWPVGQALYFQAWYRDSVGGPCGSGFNFTGAVAVRFQ